MVLCQIIYVSAASPRLDSNDLPHILKHARERNRTLNISGLLLFQDGTFVQVLEGPKQDVQPLLEKIAKDTRHQNMKVLLQKDIETKEFEDWAMGYVDARAVASRLEGFINPKTGLPRVIDDQTTAQKALRRFLDGTYKRIVEH